MATGQAKTKAPLMIFISRNLLCPCQLRLPQLTRLQLLCKHKPAREKFYRNHHCVCVVCVRLHQQQPIQQLTVACTRTHTFLRSPRLSRTHAHYSPEQQRTRRLVVFSFLVFGKKPPGPGVPAPPHPISAAATFATLHLNKDNG